MEFTGQAFEEMQEQNIRVLQELREKEEANLKLMSEVRRYIFYLSCVTFKRSILLRHLFWYYRGNYNFCYARFISFNQITN